MIVWLILTAMAAGSLGCVIGAVVASGRFEDELRRRAFVAWIAEGASYGGTDADEDPGRGNAS